MKNCFKHFLLLLSCALMSCDDDDGQTPKPNLITDIVSPKIEIIEPQPNDSVLVIDGFKIYAELSDDKMIDHVSVTLTDPSGNSQLLSKQTLNERNFGFVTYSRVPKHTATGEYKITVEAEDKGKNVAQKSVTINLHASDIHSEYFIKSFSYILYDVMSEFGYNPWDLGYVVDESLFGKLLYLMVSTNSESGIAEAEWGNFIADFNVKNQAWPNWDIDRNGKLNEKEFSDGITRLGFFKDWDTNQNRNISDEEFGAAVFSHWDHNRDNVLSRDEYLERSYTYLYTEGK